MSWVKEPLCRGSRLSFFLREGESFFGKETILGEQRSIFLWSIAYFLENFLETSFPQSRSHCLMFYLFIYYEYTFFITWTTILLFLWVDSLLPDLFVSMF